MIALALLFVVIIGLLLLIVRLLQKYFESYNNVKTTHEQNIKTHKYLKIAKNNRSFHGINHEINTVINERLTEMERKFPASDAQEEEPERITTALRQVLLSSLSLLKVVERDREL